ncbi:MAG TPA: SIS domain-containing protein [Methylomirabilota bacterium]|jgi:glucosamine--fructose-6-phosphate aminotransferase (isomerizing)|nr:SIS domain-containing protein [Methylomirabilota bacterium]
MTDPPRRASGDLPYADYVAAALAEAVDPVALRAAAARGARDLLAARPGLPRGRLLFTGSGDSLFAAASTVPAFRRWTGLAAHALSSLECARYEVPLLGPEDVVLAISNSGGSTRTRETVILARSRGNPTVSLTGSATGGLADLTDLVIHRPVAAVTRPPVRYQRLFQNMVQYLATLYTVYALGLEIGQALGRLSSARTDDWFRTLDQVFGSIVPVMRDTQEPARALADALAGADTLWVLGAGPNAGTAGYCAAKCHEQVPINGIPQDLEEWAHLQYFLTLAWGQRSAVVVLAPPGNALDRAEELVTGIAGAGGRAIVVQHPAHGAFPAAAARFPVAATESELLTPILYQLPVQSLVLCLLDRLGVAETPWRRRDDYVLIRHGTVRPTAAGLS